jgi:hypothetical protein
VISVFFDALQIIQCFSTISDDVQRIMDTRFFRPVIKEKTSFDSSSTMRMTLLILWSCFPSFLLTQESFRPQPVLRIPSFLAPAIDVHLAGQACDLLVSRLG